MQNDPGVGRQGLALDVDGLTRRFGRPTAVERNAFAVRAGTVSGSVGPNGAGKPATRRIVGSGPTNGGRFRLRGRAHKVALTVHILASVGWFGIAVGLASCVLAAGNTSDGTLAHALYRTMETAPWLSIPVGIAAIASGAVLALGTPFGLIRHWWVIAKIAIATAVVVTDAVLLGMLARHALVIGSAPGPLYGSSVAHVVVLALAVVVSVFKPRGLTPWGRSRRAATSAP